MKMIFHNDIIIYCKLVEFMTIDMNKYIGLQKKRELFALVHFQIHRCLICILLACLGGAFSSSNVGGIEASNILGGPGQHASFSFVRPGLTQTSYAFNGPSSHQTFSSSVGDAHLAGRVQPSLAGALSYRNPGLGN